MANTYTQIHIQLVFAVKFRAALISPEWNNELHAYITGIIQNNEHKMLQINSMPDHIHALIGLRPHQAISDLVQNVKCESSKWVKRTFPRLKNFAWQQGFGAFSYSKKDIGNVIRYIQNQQAHHATESFLQEYKRFLQEFGVEYDDHYIFTDLI